MNMVQRCVSKETELIKEQTLDTEILNTGFQEPRQVKTC